MIIEKNSITSNKEKGKYIEVTKKEQMTQT